MSLTPTPPGALASSIDALSDRQFESLLLAATGLSSAGIAEKIGISPRTVDEHLAAACEALNVRTRIQAVARLAKVTRDLSEPRSFLP